MSTRKMMEKYKALPLQVRASVWFLICSFLQKGISMISTPIFTRIMNTSEYGQFGVFNSWLSIITIIVCLNLYAGVHTQGLVKFNNESATFTSSLQGLTTVLVFAWTVVYVLFYKRWNNLLSLTTVQMLAMLVMIWMSAIFGFWANEQRVTYSYKTLVIVTVIVSIAKPVLGVFLVINSQDKVTARILGLMLVEIVGYFWMYIVQIKRGKVFYSKRFWSYALAFNIPLVPHYLSQMVLSSADRIMIRSMIGSSEAGIYNLAYSISLIMTLFNSALMQTISPWMYKKIKDNKIKEIAPVAYTTLILIAAVNLLLILLAPEAVSICAPKAYYDAIWVIPPIAMSVFFMYCYDLFAKFAFYYEKTTLIMFASASGAVLNIGLNYIFIDRYGYVAAGYTTLLCYMVYCLVHYHIMKKVCIEKCKGEMPYTTISILKTMIPFLIFGFLLLFLYRLPFLRYAIVVCASVVLIVFRKKIGDVIKNVYKLRNS